MPPKPTSRRVLAILLLLLGAALIAVVRSVLAVGSLPDEVLQNSDIARKRMHRLLTGLYLYYNEHVRAPSDPSELFPRYVPDPLTFWHPGDSDPPPITIDNSVPNAPNSARISFEWSDLDVEHGPWDREFLRDNSAANNAGHFVNILYGTGIETDPPFVTPTPTRVYVAQSHVRAIAYAMQFYMNDYERMPISALRLWESTGYSRTENFWNPGHPLPPPPTFTTSEPDLPNSAQGSFFYYGMGFRPDELRPNQILMRDNHSRNNGRVGYNVVWGDFRVTFEVDGTRGDENSDGHIDAADWATMNGCFTGPNSPIIEIRCRYFDWDSDDRVDLYDSAHFTGAFAP